MRKAGPLVVGALLLAGCAQKLDTGRIESDIQQKLTERTGAKVVSVACPGNVKPKQGESFRCTVKTASGRQVPVEVVQEDDSGTVRWRVVPR